MDVKTVFLNGYLEKNIYMEQPDGFIMDLSKHRDHGTNVLIRKSNILVLIKMKRKLVYIER